MWAPEKIMTPYVVHCQHQSWPIWTRENWSEHFLPANVCPRTPLHRYTLIRHRQLYVLSFGTFINYSCHVWRPREFSFVSWCLEMHFISVMSRGGLGCKIRPWSRPLDRQWDGRSGLWQDVLPVSPPLVMRLYILTDRWVKYRFNCTEIKWSGQEWC